MLFQFLMLSANLPETQIPCIWWGAGVDVPTFNAESKSAKNPNSLYLVGVVGRMRVFQLLILSSNLSKT